MIFAERDIKAALYIYHLKNKTVFLNTQIFQQKNPFSSSEKGFFIKT